MSKKQVDFYLISNRLRDAKYKLASRLANKLSRLDKKALIITDSKEQTEHLSQIMWSFRDSSFLAHERIDQLENQAEIAKRYKQGLNFVVIGDALSVSAEILENNFSVMINLASEVPIYSHHFERVAEIVESDDSEKKAARTRYKHYQGEGFSIETHSLEL